jgi:hypothetical protein
MNSDSIASHASIDGESLDTCDWMELVARGAVSNRELEESFFPMTIDFNEDPYHTYGCKAVFTDEQSEIRSDDSSEISGKDFSSTDEEESHPVRKANKMIKTWP